MWYIFNKENSCMAKIDYEPDCLDLESREEYSISSEYDYEDYKNLIYKDGQIVEKPPEPINIEELKTAKIAEMKAERDNREVQDIEYNGKMFDYDDKSRERLTLARQALEDNGTDSILWTCADNTFATLTLEDFKAINTLSATRSTQLHEQYNKLKLLINSLETEEQIKEVTFDTDTSNVNLEKVYNA